MLDWDGLRYFLAIARHGSLSAAARELRVTQSTMGRRLEALEARLGVRLLQRTPDGYVLTPAGTRVFDSTEKIESEALGLEREVAGYDARLEGIVRVTTIETLGALVLAPLLVELRRRLPGVLVELVTDNQSLSLFKRDADIAVRMAKPEQHDLVVKKAGEVSFALYASKSYLDERGTPDFSTECDGHAIITFQDDFPPFPDARWLSQVARKATVILASNSRYTHLEAALSGAGIVCVPHYLADRHSDLVRLNAPSRAPRREIWLAAHRDTRRTPRIRVVFSAIADGLKARASMLRAD